MVCDIPTDPYQQLYIAHHTDPLRAQCVMVIGHLVLPPWDLKAEGERRLLSVNMGRMDFVANLNGSRMFDELVVSSDLGDVSVAGFVGNGGVSLVPSNGRASLTDIEAASIHVATSVEMVSLQNIILSSDIVVKTTSSDIEVKESQETRI
ncbi:hypothetical protein HDU76_000857 [Blyttiomyces sp. JEL0837]|nr:hypothetical protein HDU76_000857 [Blyttiomyces sp. JEL0837]